MSDLLRYFEAKAETRAAKAEREAASARLELARIKERLAEIVSQHEPLASILASDDMTRAKAVAAARYVVVGRMDHNLATKEEAND